MLKSQEGRAPVIWFEERSLKNIRKQNKPYFGYKDCIVVKLVISEGINCKFWFLIWLLKDYNVLSFRKRKKERKKERKKKNTIQPHDLQCLLMNYHNMKLRTNTVGKEWKSRKGLYPKLKSNRLYT